MAAPNSKHVELAHSLGDFVVQKVTPQFNAQSAQIAELGVTLNAILARLDTIEAMSGQNAQTAATKRPVNVGAVATPVAAAPVGAAAAAVSAAAVPRTKKAAAAAVPAVVAPVVVPAFVAPAIVAPAIVAPAIVAPVVVPAVVAAAPAAAADAKASKVPNMLNWFNNAIIQNLLGLRDQFVTKDVRTAAAAANVTKANKSEADNLSALGRYVWGSLTDDQKKQIKSQRSTYEEGLARNIVDPQLEEE